MDNSATPPSSPKSNDEPNSLSSDEWKALAQSLRQAQTEAETPDLVDRSFLTQAAFLLDVAVLIVVLCTRRAGKSFGAALRLLRAAYKHPGSSCLYIALTRDSAEKILWKDCLKVINRTLNLGINFNETKLRATLPNGSVIYLLGVDTDEEEKQKLLGQKYAEVVIDEAASYAIDLNELVYGILKPAVADYRGTIVLIGTPGNLKNGLFFELTEGQDPGEPGRWEKRGWSGHRWSAMDNPHMRDKWEAEIAELIAANPLIEQTPLFQQHYRGRWVIDDSKLVYRYVAGRNDYDGTLPVIRGKGEWHFVLGIDLGFTDAASFTVGAYHDNDTTLRYVLSYKKPGLDITATSEEADRIKAVWPIEQTVIDGANKQAVEELNRRHGLAAIPADKREKAEFIDIMNAEMIQDRVKVSPQCQDLKDEWVALIWDERALAKRKRVEHPGCENHCADGALYVWRHCWQYLATAPPQPTPALNTAAWYEAQEQHQRQEMEAQMEREFVANQQEQRERNLEGWD